MVLRSSNLTRQLLGDPLPTISPLRRSQAEQMNLRINEMCATESSAIGRDLGRCGGSLISPGKVIEAGVAAANFAHHRQALSRKS